MTVPFIMALGLGVSAVRSDNDNSFGLTGICSVGPVLAVILYSLFLKSKGLFDSYQVEIISETVSNSVEGNIFYQMFCPYGKIFLHTAKEAMLSILPLVGLFIIFQVL